MILQPRVKQTDTTQPTYSSSGVLPVRVNQPPQQPLTLQPNQKKLTQTQLSQLDLSTPIQSPSAQFKTIIPKTPIKKDEPGGLFDMVKNTIRNIVTDRASKVDPKRIIQDGRIMPWRAFITPDEEKKLVKFAVSFGKETLRAPPRAGVSVVLTAAGQKEFKPGTGGLGEKAEKFLYGDRPIRDIRGTGEETITGFGGSPETATKYGLPLGILLTGLDLIPDIPKKKIAKIIAKEGSETVIKNLLKRRVFKDISDDVAETLAKKLAPIKDAKIVQKELDAFTKVKSVVTQTAVKTVLEEAPKAGKLPKQEISLPGIRGKSPTYIEHPTLPKGYTETPQIAKAIEETARAVKEPISTTRRVINAVSEIKTKVVEYVQNTDERIRQLQAKKGIQVDDVSDPYLKATLYPGRVADKVTQGKKVTEDIIKDSKKLADEFKTDLATVRKEVHDYLLFRHAPERNLALGEKAAGITTSEAQTGLKALENSLRGAKIKELADKAGKLNEQTLDLLKGSGVISDELYTTLRTKYKNHVPLNRIFEETEDIGSALSGKGFDVRATGIKRAKGSEREVSDILENIVTNYEQAVLRSEKNIVDGATLAFVRKNKDILGDAFTILKPRAIGKDFKGNILRERTTDPSILQMFEKGDPVWIKIKDPHLAVALRGIGREKLGSLLNAINMFTRTYSGLHTRFNPEFALPNKIRDLQETAVYLASQKEIGFTGAAKTIARDLSQQNTRAVLDSIRGVDSEGAKLYNELKALGGTTGGMGLSTKAQVSLNLKNIEKLANSKTRRIADNLVGYIDNWNTIFEDSTRLSVYRQSLKQGLSKERAAFLAKEASINFNRMGKGGPVINALWMFSNASIQGTTKMIRALKNPKVLGATILAVGSSVAAVNQWNDRVDSDWRDKVSRWDRLNGLPIVLPNSSGEGVKYITIPVSWGIKPIKVTADYVYDAVSGKGFDAKEFIGTTLTSMIEAYNPAGGTDLVSALTPSILDIPVEIGRNKSWTGSKIKPDFDPNAPEDIKYFQSLKETKTGQTAISIAELLQSKAGISVSPANMKYAFEGYVGGVGRTASKTVNTIIGALGGKPAPIDEYPMISRFYRERTQEEIGQKAIPGEFKGILEEQSREKLKAKEKITPIYKQVQKLKKEGKDDEVHRIVESLSDKDWEIYENIKTSEKSKQTKVLQKKMYPTVQKVQKLKKEGKDDEVQNIVDEMTDEEYKAYKSAKKQLGIE